MVINPQGFSFEQRTYYSPNEKTFYHHMGNIEVRARLVKIMNAKVVDFEILRGYARKLPWTFTFSKFWGWNESDENKCRKVRDEIDKLCGKYNIT